VHAIAMAEYVLGAALMAMEHIPQRLANQERRAWATARWDLASRGLRGRTALIVGYGSVGREAARLLHACGVRVLAVKRDPLLRADVGWVEPGTGDPDCNIPTIVAGPDALTDLASEADLLVLTMPGTASTARLVDARVLGALKPGAWIINVGRGSAIDEGALLEALRTERLGGAVLDVTTQEPLAEDHPFWSEPRCVVTPHVSGLGDIDAMWHRVARLFAENLRRDAAGAPLLNLTSGVRGY
jgi:phosphoglycerate dehydrogenase-like enzyme